MKSFFFFSKPSKYACGYSSRQETKRLKIMNERSDRIMKYSFKHIWDALHTFKWICKAANLTVGRWTSPVCGMGTLKQSRKETGKEAARQQTGSRFINRVSWESLLAAQTGSGGWKRRKVAVKTRQEPGVGGKARKRLSVHLCTAPWGWGTRPVRCPTPPCWWRRPSRTAPRWDDQTAFSRGQAG